MADKIAELESKVLQVLEKLDRMKNDNASLKEENVDLQSRLSKLIREFETFKVSHNDQAEQVKSKLTSVLSRLEELEKIGL